MEWEREIPWFGTTMFLLAKEMKRWDTETQWYRIKEKQKKWRNIKRENKRTRKKEKERKIEREYARMMERDRWYRCNLGNQKYYA